MSKATILVVDDEPKIVRFIQTSLSLADYDVLTAATGSEALRACEEQRPNLIVLDLGLPDIDGFDVLREIRATSVVPIIILTARDDEQDKVRGLEAGADDYLTKPFGTQELTARIQAVLRRVEWAPQTGDLPEFSWRDLQVDFRRRRVVIRGQQVHLTPHRIRSAADADPELRAGAHTYRSADACMGAGVSQRPGDSKSEHLATATEAGRGRPAAGLHRHGAGGGLYAA